MLRPKKSLQAVFGVTPEPARVADFTHLTACERCSLRSCTFRRAAYRHSPSQIEDVSGLRSRTGRPLRRAQVQPLTGPAATRYHTSLKALRKWTQERLHLTFHADESVDARFRYEGTTCLNLGYRLQYDYHIKLSQPSQDYRITDLRCVPAPGDTGYRRMCEYLDNPQGLMRSIEREKPLLGRPIGDVLTWDRQANPAGCYCDAEGRDHKWRLVFECVHYALSQTRSTRSFRRGSREKGHVEHPS